MIQFVFDHSYEDDYYMLSHININIEDPVEKDRIKRKLNELNLGGLLIFPNKQFQEKIAKELNVETKMIDFDTNEIDLM